MACGCARRRAALGNAVRWLVYRQGTELNVQLCERCARPLAAADFEILAVPALGRCKLCAAPAACTWRYVVGRSAEVDALLN
jgi:predicted RNA-binding Zn ribbon-like protein